MIPKRSVEYTWGKDGKMTYDKAVNALVAAGLLDQAKVKTATSVLAGPSVEFTYPAWADALAQAGLIDKSEVGAATDAMEQAGVVEAKDDPDAFEAGLENAGIL
jgi:hypothetical protein